MVRSVSRLPELGRRVVGLRLAVGLTLAQHPIACLGEVPGDGDDGSPMSLAGSESSIEQADVAFAIGAQMRRAGGGFDECPLEIAVDVVAGAAVTGMAARGDDARHEAGVAGQVFGSGETFDVADLPPQDGRENLGGWRTLDFVLPTLTTKAGALRCPAFGQRGRPQMPALSLLLPSFSPFSQ